jgi:hypothetical protein
MNTTVPNSYSPQSVDMNWPFDQKLRWFKTNFRPHFDDWVFGPIDRLVNSDDALIGFIFMSCTIDYLAGFWYGKSTKDKVNKVYRCFIDSYFPKNRYDSWGLWDSLRNGLVHMFTIKGKIYTLTQNQPNLHLHKNQKGQIFLDARSFRDDLFFAKEDYFNDVQSKKDLLDKLIDRFIRYSILHLELEHIKTCKNNLSGSHYATSSKA